MANAGSSPARRRLLSGATALSNSQWIVDKLTTNWAAIIAVIGGGGGMSYLASVTDWHATWGPVAWGTIGIASMLLLSAVYLVYGKAHVALSAARF
jgi:hypothetical protein